MADLQHELEQLASLIYEQDEPNRLKGADDRPVGSRTASSTSPTRTGTGTAAGTGATVAASTKYLWSRCSSSDQRNNNNQKQQQSWSDSHSRPGDDERTTATAGSVEGDQQQQQQSNCKCHNSLSCYAASADRSCWLERENTTPVLIENRRDLVKETNDKCYSKSGETLLFLELPQ